MKQVLFLIPLLLISMGISGQNLPFSMTVNAGLNISDMDIQYLKSNPQAGFKGNVTLEYNLPNKFFLQTGLEYTNKGAKSDNKFKLINAEGQTVTNNTLKEKYDTHYLAIPLMGGYRLDVSDKVRMNLSLGPYFAYGVGGKSKIYGGLPFSYETNPTQDISSLHEVNSFDIFRRFDMGLEGNVGIEYFRYLLNVGYEYGFINQFKKGDLSSYNMNLFVTLGLRIF